MESVISNLLDELETELSEAKKSVILGGKAVVDTDACLGILDELRETLPTEIERAGNIMRERRQILIDAEEEAKQCILAAQKTADEMVQEHEITRNAEIEGKKIIDMARQNAKEVRLSAKNYALSIFEELKDRLKDLDDQVTQDFEDFNK